MIVLRTCSSYVSMKTADSWLQVLDVMISCVCLVCPVRGACGVHLLCGFLDPGLVSKDLIRHFDTHI